MKVIFDIYAQVLSKVNFTTQLARKYGPPQHLTQGDVLAEFGDDAKPPPKGVIPFRSAIK